MLASRFHPAAEAELLETKRYINEDDATEAALFEQAFSELLALVCREPLVFRSFDGDFRKVRVGKFRYALIFRLRGHEIQILAVAHMSRRPGYWKTRARSWPD